jgi:hypothetical protein
MKARRTLVLIVGIIQSVIATLVFISAFSLYFNFFDVQTLVDAAVETLYFHVSALLVFGFFSVISGLFLVHEWLESR